MRRAPSFAPSLPPSLPRDSDPLIMRFDVKVTPNADLQRATKLLHFSPLPSAVAPSSVVVVVVEVPSRIFARDSRRCSVPNGTKKARFRSFVFIQFIKLR